ncbi:ribosome biogenesis protein ytm1 [Coemansia sp. RSA 1853]|nr:ribosome biogenesis protein ytm1 [Coemansia sp. RSA 1853]
MGGMDAFVEHVIDGDWSGEGRPSDSLLNTVLDLEAASQLSQKLEQRLLLSQKKIRNSLDENYSTYSAAVTKVGSAQSSIAQLLQGVDELQLMLGDEETGIQIRLDTAIKNEEQICERVQSNSAILQCLTRLSAINRELQDMDKLVQSGELDKAAQKAESIETAVNAMEDIEDTHIAVILAERVNLARMNIKENVLREFHKAIAVETDSNSAKLRVDSSRLEGRISVLFAALDSVKDGENGFQELALYIISAFVKPVLAAQLITCDDAESPSSEFSVQLSNDGGTTPAAEVCNLVLSIVAFVSRVLGDRVWVDAALTELAQLVLQRCYLQRIPETRTELAAFYKTVDTLSDFEATLLAKCADPSTKRPIQTAVKRLDELFVERQCARALEQSRRAAESTAFAVYKMDTHQEWSLAFVQVTVEDADTKLASSFAQSVKAHPAAVFPQCIISESIVGTVSSAYRLLNESMQCNEPGLAQKLAETAQNVLDVYCVLFPVVHRQQLHKVPALALQFFNDCMYGAHHSTILGQLAATENNVNPSWSVVARKFFDTGIRHAAELAESESRELKSLVGADNGTGFYNASDEQQKDALAKALKRGRLALTQLCAAMRPPNVTPHMFYRILGRYLDAMFAAIIDGIVGVRDIGVDDSQVLSDHCRAAYSLVSLFHLDPEITCAYSTLTSAALVNTTDEQGDSLLDSDDESDESDTAARGAQLAKKHCHMSDKLVQLADILMISRADILARRRAGLLAQYSVDELVSLVRALFSDTHERALDIDELKRI